jgi:hypothetical protein
MFETMAVARTLLAVLVLAVFAAPAQAWPPRSPADTGGTAVTDVPADGGGTAPIAPAVPVPWPPNTTVFPAPGLNPLGDLFPPLPPVEPPLPATTTVIRGKIARLRTDGLAAIPRGAPKRVRSLISQYNRIVGRSYRWGGGHLVVDDVAFDCSGAVGYGLIKTGMLHTTMVSGSFARWASGGPGRWVTIYANRTHVYTEVAGLRLDTSPYGEADGADGVRWRPVVGQRVGFKVRHPVGL